MFKDWIKDMFTLDMEVSDDVNVDIARANYQKYQDDLKCKQTNYIKTVCQRIKILSREGKQYIKTLSEGEEPFITRYFIQEMKEYFEKRGFKVQKNHDYYGTPYLKISWDEGDKQ